MRRLLIAACLSTALAGLDGGLHSAAAELQFCNETDVGVSVAVGYEADDGEWASEGWWRIEPDACKTTLKGELTRQSYYWRATSSRYDWEESRFMFCTSPEVFTIRGDTNCAARGYERSTFNRIELPEGVLSFRYRLTADAAKEPAQAASQKAAAPGEVDRDPPGTHGEPYTIAGLLGGCEGTDTTFWCDLYANGYRYRATTGGATPTATIERLMDVPVNTPMVWSGDMISYAGSLAEVTIRGAREEGDDPFADVRARLQGYWISTEDQAYTLLIAGALFEEYYDNVPTDSLVVEIAGTCQGSRGAGPYLIAHPLARDDEPRCFEIVEATDDALTLFPLGTMGFLDFRRGS
ncbi:DUF1036 domain-containing protein [Amorphus orientalis]|uniref:Membrane protein n=1 Tax=Amorphus orientalis TaxID=649198 RepID=A0AAE3VPF6_9HYPH|nr:DUF1036 domain-containing protein [Amorphus orientalis]MDQ0315336.1 putative membrane protein [Amorphus orientalis]